MGNLREGAKHHAQGTRRGTTGAAATAPVRTLAGRGSTIAGATCGGKGSSGGDARCTATELVPSARGAVPGGYHGGNQTSVHATRRQGAPRQNPHHTEKAEGLFKQTVKAKDGMFDTEACTCYDAGIERGDKHQQWAARQDGRSAAKHVPK